MPIRRFLSIVWGNFMNDNTISVRAACPEDAKAIHRVVSLSMQVYCRNAGIPADKLDANSETVDDIREAILSVPFFAAINSNGSIVGSVRLLFKKVSSFGIPELPGRLSLSPDDFVPYFSRFAVQEDVQGLGIGSLLYLAAEKEARDRHSTHILLHTAICNRVMVSFYEKRGFVLLFEDSSRGYPRGLFCKAVV